VNYEDQRIDRAMEMRNVFGEIEESKRANAKTYKQKADAESKTKYKTKQR
jgi:hypothetical protein